MKIERQAVTITEVPGIHSIQVTPEGSVFIQFSPDYSRTLRLAELDGLIEALQLARTELTTQFSPRMFVKGDSIPDDVTKVRDFQDDFWYRQMDGRWDLTPEGTEDPWSASWVLKRYGPVTEVRP